MPSILRPPRNTICGSCYEGARTTIALLKKLDGSKEDNGKLTDKSTFNNGSALSSPLFSLIFKKILDSDEYKTATEYAITLQELKSEELQALLGGVSIHRHIASDKLEKHVYTLFVAADSKTLKEAALGFVVRNMDVLVFKDIFSRILKKTKAMADQQRNMDLFHDGLAKIFKEQWHPDVLCFAGEDDHEDPIPANKVILGARSDELRELFDGDGKETETIILYGMNHEALEVFIEFMYVGNSIQYSEKLKKHARSLYFAANLYSIPLLRDLCRYQLMSSLNIGNALDILEISKDDPREKTLHDEARCYVIRHMKEIAFTREFNWFVKRNTSLTVELIRDMTTQTNLEVFVHGLVKVFKEQWGVDVWLKPGHNNDGDELIAAHKIILAARSKVFATMFESDKIKNWTVHETITLSDLKRKELEVFVEFCYAGECMPSEKLKKHAMSRYCAADKYEIPYLRDLCRNHIMSSINASNAVEILELSRLPFDKTLGEFANNYIDFHSSMIFPLGRFRT
ncbi:unnamed protein product [Brassica rapa]|uniref:BTB domain-containing protein n=2 Tax=Brassica TaxID=3705 RepID=A0A3P6BU74_BRACM|nr:unnamed protein product [Brassica napus]CAG7902827.1 unnamed protein product [Brassica rapa]VDC99288.1 unnamed protein product [Brassica rapa]